MESEQLGMGSKKPRVKTVFTQESCSRGGPLPGATAYAKARGVICLGNAE